MKNTAFFGVVSATKSDTFSEIIQMSDFINYDRLSYSKRGTDENLIAAAIDLSKAL